MSMFNVRLSPEELEQIEEYRQLLQQQYGSKVRVTQKTVILTALEKLGSSLKRSKQNHRLNEENSGK